MSTLKKEGIKLPELTIMDSFITVEGDIITIWEREGLSVELVD